MPVVTLLGVGLEVDLAGVAVEAAADDDAPDPQSPDHLLRGLELAGDRRRPRVAGADPHRVAGSELALGIDLYGRAEVVRGRGRAAPRARGDRNVLVLELLDLARVAVLEDRPELDVANAAGGVALEEMT